MTIDVNQRIFLANLIGEVLELPPDEVSKKIDLIVDKITLELSKGNSIYHPCFLIVDPVIQEAREINIPFIEKSVKCVEHISFRVKYSRKLKTKLKKYGLKNLNLL